MVYYDNKQADRIALENYYNQNQYQGGFSVVRRMGDKSRGCLFEDKV